MPLPLRQTCSMQDQIAAGTTCIGVHSLMFVNRTVTQPCSPTQHPHVASEAPQVPILVDNGATIIESALVVEYLDKAYPDIGTKLYPDDPAAAFKVLAGSCCCRPNEAILHCGTKAWFPLSAVPSQWQKLVLPCLRHVLKTQLGNAC